MKNFRFHIIVLLLLASPCAESYAQHTASTPALVQTLAEAFLKKSKLPGLSMAVAKDHEIIYSQGPSLSPVAFSQNIEIIEHKSNGEIEKYPGKISLAQELGQITGDGSGTLQRTDFYYLGFGDHYAAVSSYGLLYLTWQRASSLGNGLFIYGSRNADHPINQPATYSFKSIEQAE